MSEAILSYKSTQAHAIYIQMAQIVTLHHNNTIIFDFNYYLLGINQQQPALYHNNFKNAKQMCLIVNEWKLQKK